MNKVEVEDDLVAVSNGPAQLNSLHVFFLSLFLFLMSFLTFYLGLQNGSFKLLNICKIQNKVLEYYGTYFLFKLNIKYSYAFGLYGYICLK